MSPKCPKCANNTFIAYLTPVLNLNSPISVICCSNCYTAIGVKDTVDVKIVLEHIDKRIDEITQK